jgi:transcriptional regulator with XRE-family HTH domain
MKASPAPADAGPATAGARLQRLRAERRTSQLELSLRVGVSQRHLSCVETGRAGASRELLLALLDALEAPLSERNEVLLAAGFAPAYGRRSLEQPDMAPAREALAHLLAVHEPAPAVVLDGAWNLVQANGGAAALVRLLGAAPAALAPGTNMLRATFLPGGLREALLNPDEVCAAVWQRAVREAAHNPELQAVIEALHPHAPRPAAPAGDAPLLLTRLRGPAGELRFFSAFTTFGTPLDVTLASLRVEHMFPADEATRRALADEARR